MRTGLRRGQWERALEGARRVEPLDPRSTEPLWDATMALTHLRRFPEALAVVDRALVLDSLSPGWYPARLDILGAQGGSAGVRRTVDLAERRLGYSRRSYLGRYLIHQWMLPDTARAFLLRVRPSAMEGDTIDWALAAPWRPAPWGRSPRPEPTPTPPGASWRRVRRSTGRVTRRWTTS